MVGRVPPYGRNFRRDKPRGERTRYVCKADSSWWIQRQSGGRNLWLIINNSLRVYGSPYTTLGDAIQGFSEAVGNLDIILQRSERWAA